MLYNLFAQEGIPQGPMEILLMPVGMTILGLAIFMAGWYVQNRLNKAPWKWIGVIPVLYGLYVGWGTLNEWRTNPVLNTMLTGKKWTGSYWACFVFPLLGLITIACFHFFNSRINRAFDE